MTAIDALVAEAIASAERTTQGTAFRAPRHHWFSFGPGEPQLEFCRIDVRDAALAHLATRVVNAEQRAERAERAEAALASIAALQPEEPAVRPNTHANFFEAFVAGEAHGVKVGHFEAGEIARGVTRPNSSERAK